MSFSHCNPDKGQKEKLTTLTKRQTNQGAISECHSTCILLFFSCQSAFGWLVDIYRDANGHTSACAQF